MKFPKAHIKTVIGALLCLFLGISSPLIGQQVWSGDVSGNCIVDHQDMLFWAYARNKTGAMRPNASTAFVGQDIPADSLASWSGTFPNTDRSLAFADCDGNGIVNDLDLLTINQNYFYPSVVKRPLINLHSMIALLAANLFWGMMQL